MCLLGKVMQTKKKAQFNFDLKYCQFAPFLVTEILLLDIMGSYKGHNFKAKQNLWGATARNCMLAVLTLVHNQGTEENHGDAAWIRITMLSQPGVYCVPVSPPAANKALSFGKCSQIDVPFKIMLSK